MQDVLAGEDKADPAAWVEMHCTWGAGHIDDAGVMLSVLCSTSFMVFVMTCLAHSMKLLCHDVWRTAVGRLDIALKQMS